MSHPESSTQVLNETALLCHHPNTAPSKSRSALLFSCYCQGPSLQPQKSQRHQISVNRKKMNTGSIYAWKKAPRGNHQFRCQAAKRWERWEFPLSVQIMQLQVCENKSVNRKWKQTCQGLDSLCLEQHQPQQAGKRPFLCKAFRKAVGISPQSLGHSKQRQSGLVLVFTSSQCRTEWTDFFYIKSSVPHSPFWRTNG